jgi:putative transposase
VQHRAYLFGEITDGKMILNDAGEMVEREWLALLNRFPNIVLHEYITMPNHFHGILEIAVGASLVDAQNETDAQNDMDTRIDGATTRVAPTDTQNDGDTVRASLVDAQTNDIGRANDIGRPQGHAPTEVIQTNKTIGDMMDAFKSITTVDYIRGVKSLGWEPFDGKLWQRNYYEHIIRNQQSYERISEYIINNPAKWKGDKFYN